MLVAELIAILCSGLFAGAAVYITFVEHPARIEAGVGVAIAEFGPSYRRATVMQASLAVVGALAGAVAWLQGGGASELVAAVALGAVVPFTLVVILPTNRALLAPTLAPASDEARELLGTWGRLHAVRSALGLLAFLVLVV